MLLILYLILVLFFLLFSLAFVFITVAQLIADFTTDAPFISVPKEVQNEIIKTLELRDSSVLFDLGCGDGHMLVKAVESNPNISCVGIEIALWPFILAKIRTRKYKNITIKRKNIFDADISDATNIFIYLSPIVSKLAEKIKKECAPGTRVVSCDFEIMSTTPVNVVDLESVNPFGRRGKKLFVYTI